MTIKYYELAPIGTEVEISYRDASLYCSFLTANNHCDWRLPNELELNSIVKNQHHDFKTDFYWVVGGYMLFIEDNNNSVLIDGFTSMNDQSSITNKVRAIRDNPDCNPSIVNRIKYWFKNQIILNPFVSISNALFDTLFFNKLWYKYRDLH